LLYTVPAAHSPVAQRVGAPDRRPPSFARGLWRGRRGGYPSGPRQRKLGGPLPGNSRRMAPAVRTRGAPGRYIGRGQEERSLAIAILLRSDNYGMLIRAPNRAATQW